MHNGFRHGGRSWGIGLITFAIAAGHAFVGLPRRVARGQEPTAPISSSAIEDVRIATGFPLREKFPAPPSIPRAEGSAAASDFLGNSEASAPQAPTAREQVGSSLDLGRYYEKKGDLELALTEYGRAILADPNDWRGYVLRGNLYCRMQRYQDALADCDTSIGFHPGSAHPGEYALRAYVLWQMKEVAVHGGIVTTPV
jgi:tetratricopeptide (TPR) repeat protein